MGKRGRIESEVSTCVYMDVSLLGADTEQAQADYQRREPALRSLQFE